MPSDEEISRIAGDAAHEMATFAVPLVKGLVKLKQARDTRKPVLITYQEAHAILEALQLLRRDPMSKKDVKIKADKVTKGKLVPNQPPTIGRIVIYRTDGRNGLSYDLPAIVTCTKESHPGDYPDGKHNPLPVPESDMHIHLTVFSPGGHGTKVVNGSQVLSPDTTERFKGADMIISGSGTYVELNVPVNVPDDEHYEHVHPRTWRWPTIR